MTGAGGTRAGEAPPGELREPRAGLMAFPAAGFSPWWRWVRATMADRRRDVRSIADDVRPGAQAMVTEGAPCVPGLPGWRGPGDRGDARRCGDTVHPGRRAPALRRPRSRAGEPAAGTAKSPANCAGLQLI